MIRRSSLLLTVALVGCNAQQPPSPLPQNSPASSSSRILGVVELGISPNVLESSSRVSGRAALPDSAVSFAQTSYSEDVNTTTQTRYIKATYRVTNTSGAAFQNLSLIAYHQAASNIGGTALKQILNFDNGAINDASVAQKLLPTHGTQFNNVSGQLEVVQSQADFQVFTDTEVSALQAQGQALATPVLSSADTLLPYGFVARSSGNSRVIPNGGQGTLTLAFKIPNQAAGDATKPRRFQFTFLLSNEATTRVTRSPEEAPNSLDAQARATELNASEIALVGPDAGTANVGGFTRRAFDNRLIATTPTFLLEPQCASGTPAVTNTIMTVQGSTPSSDAASSLINIPQTLEGVVTANFNTSSGFNGFYIQDRFGDGNTNTSDGIFVYNKGVNTVNVGDFVRVSGTVLEGFAQTQLGRAEITGGSPQPESLTSVVGCSTRALPAPVQVSFPLTNGQADLEKFEGMRIKVPDVLAVTEHFNLDRFGELLLASSGPSDQPGTDIRLEQFTQFNAPNVAANAAHLANLDKRKLLVDDGRSVQNPPTSLYGRGGNPLTAVNTLRGGDTVTGIEGVLGYGFSAYRLQPTASVNFQATNPRPALPVNKTTGNLRVASFNVLNYFTTLNFGGATFTPAGCSNTIGPRGANTQAEFDRQKPKTVAAIRAINADVLGVIEMQNNGSSTGSAIQDLVVALNAGQPTADQYAIAPAPLNGFGCDAIKVDFIYKSASARIAPGTSPASIALASNPGFNETGRTPVAATFEQLDTSGLGTGKVVTAVMSHFKSKGSSSTGTGNTDALDGQGLSNGTRTRSANELVAWLGTTTKPTGTTDPDYVLLGDFNAYAEEDPIKALATAGYSTLIPNTEYSYVFNGQWGSLDHALGNISNTQKAQAGKLHINADEPDALDYNIQLDNGTVVKTAQQQTDLFAPDAFRSSDHDAVYVDLNLSATAVTCTVTGVTVTPNPASVVAGSTVQLSANVADTPDNCATVAWGSDNTNTPVNSSGLVTGNTAGTSSSVTATATGTGGSTASGSATVNVSAPAQSFTLALGAFTPSSLTTAGGNSSATVTLTPSGNYAGTPAYTVNGLPSSITGNVSGGVLNLTVSSSVAAGIYGISVTGTDGALNATSDSVNFTVTAVSSGAGVVISEFRFRGPSGGNDEFIELFNALSNAVNIGGWKIQGRSGSSPFVFGDRVTISANVTLQPGKFYLLTNSGASGYSFGVAGDQTYGTGIGDNQAIRLIDGSATIVDLVGFASTVCEGTCIPTGATTNPAGQASYKRQPNAGSDTNQNATDFAFGATNANPQNSASTANGAN